MGGFFHLSTRHLFRDAEAAQSVLPKFATAAKSSGQFRGGFAIEDSARPHPGACPRLGIGLREPGPEAHASVMVRACRSGPDGSAAAAGSRTSMLACLAQKNRGGSD